MILSLDVQTMLDKIETVEQLENVMSYPTKEVVNAMLELEGDLLILGVGGKMGPTLAKLAKRAIDNANLDNKVIGVSRFSVHGIDEELRKSGIDTITCNLLDDDQLFKLPGTPNVIFMAGRKFGSTDNKSLTSPESFFHVSGLLGRSRTLSSHSTKQNFKICILY